MLDRDCPVPVLGGEGSALVTTGLTEDFEASAGVAPDVDGKLLEDTEDRFPKRCEVINEVMDWVLLALARLEALSATCRRAEDTDEVSPVMRRLVGAGCAEGLDCMP